MLFLWARRLNVSAQEEPGSSGLGGLVMATMAAPVYAKALWDAVLRRPARFVVTPKGDAARPDGPATFRLHHRWALAVALPIPFAFVLGHTAPAILVWSVLTLAVCVTPGLLAMAHAVRAAARDEEDPVVASVAPAEALGGDPA